MPESKLTRSGHRRSGWRAAVGLGAALAAVLVLAACGSSSSASGDASGGSGGDSAGIRYAQAQVDKYEAAPAPPVPGAQVNIGDKLKGKKLWDVVYLATVPGFVAVFQAARAAAARLGMTAQLCDAGGTNAGGASCMQEAVRAHAGAIFLDDIQVDDVQGPFKQAEAAKIPVVGLDQLPSTQAKDAELEYMPFAQLEMERLNADYVIAKSNGAAHVLLTEISDDPTAQVMINAGKNEFAKYCPKCAVTTVQTTATDTNQIPSVVSAGLLKNPDTNWVIPEFDNFASLAQQGVSQAGKTSQVRGVSDGGAVGSIQEVASGEFLDADFAENQNEPGWMAVNLLVHMVAGKPISSGQTEVQLRLVTKATASKLPLTAAAYASGAWFNRSYQAALLRLWGVTQ
jgi:ABC-type sugar transport system substrate-binding protein